MGFPDGSRWVSLVVQMVKNLPVLGETQVQSLGLEDPLEKGMATRSSTLTWRIPWTKEGDNIQLCCTPLPTGN